MDICSATSYPFEFTSKIKSPTLDTIKFRVTTLINQYKKVTFTQVDEYRALARYSGFMKTCNDMNIMVQTTGGYESYLNCKSESPNKTLDNITRTLLLNSIHKKQP